MTYNLTKNINGIDFDVEVEIGPDWAEVISVSVAGQVVEEPEHMSFLWQGSHHTLTYILEEFAVENSAAIKAGALDNALGILNHH